MYTVKPLSNNSMENILFYWVKKMKVSSSPHYRSVVTQPVTLDLSGAYMRSSFWVKAPS